MTKLLKAKAIIRESIKTYPDYSFETIEILKKVTFLGADGMILWLRENIDAYEGYLVVYLAPEAFASYRKLLYCYGRFMFTGLALYNRSYRMFYKTIRNELYKILEELITLIKEIKKDKQLVLWEGEEDEK